MPLLLTPLSTFIFFFCQRPVALRDLPSFPTRRSSDLVESAQAPHRGSLGRREQPVCGNYPDGRNEKRWAPRCVRRRAFFVARSEEHTSELQSRVDLVCRLLLEKKKTNYEAR